MNEMKESIHTTVIEILMRDREKRSVHKSWGALVHADGGHLKFTQYKHRRHICNKTLK